jgi:hypothetical protein
MPRVRTAIAGMEYEVFSGDRHISSQGNLHTLNKSQPQIGASRDACDNCSAEISAAMIRILRPARKTRGGESVSSGLLVTIYQYQPGQQYCGSGVQFGEQLISIS